jgi:hypothetical protein
MPGSSLEKAQATLGLLFFVVPIRKWTLANRPELLLDFGEKHQHGIGPTESNTFRDQSDSTFTQTSPFPIAARVLKWVT